MSIVETGPGVGLDTTDPATPNGRKPIVTEVREKWETADRALARERRDFWLNLAFMLGEQWVYWHPSSRTVAEFPRPKKSQRVRLTINRIQPNLINVMAKLTKRPITFEVLSTGATDDTLAGARLSETVLEASHDEQGWEDVRGEEILNALLGGTSAVVLEWDGQGGEELEVDQASGKVVGTGEVQLTALNIAEFTIEPGSRRKEDARWFIMARALPAEQVQEKFGMAEKPKADVDVGSSPLHRRLLEESGYPTATELTVVLSYYERPNGKSKGRYVCVVGDDAVHDGPWPFPFKKLNIETFRQTRIPGKWVGHTYCNDARPVQVGYNQHRSNIAEHAKLAGAAKLAIPDAAGIDGETLTDTPGEHVYYDGTAGAPPNYIAPPQLPRWLIEEATRLASELDDIMHVHGISRGEAPGDRNAAAALAMLSEKDDSPLGLMAHEQASGWANLASMVLELYAAKVEGENRTAVVDTDAGVPVAVKWTGKQLRDQTRAKVPLDAVLPHSRAAMQAWVMQLSQSFPSVAAALQGPQLARMMDLPGAGFLGELMDADAAKAQAENHLFAAEMPELPETFDDHGKHIAEHNRFRKSRAYEYGSQETRELADLHVLSHQKLAEEELARQRDANAAMPGLGAVPQAHEPPGSAVPQDHAERQAQESMAARGGAGGGAPSSGPPGMG